MGLSFVLLYIVFVFFGFDVLLIIVFFGYEVVVCGVEFIGVEVI